MSTREKYTTREIEVKVVEITCDVLGCEEQYEGETIPKRWVKVQEQDNIDSQSWHGMDGHICPKCAKRFFGWG